MHEQSPPTQPEGHPHPRLRLQQGCWLHGPQQPVQHRFPQQIGLKAL
jgi:hypothetical protein